MSWMVIKNHDVRMVIFHGPIKKWGPVTKSGGWSKKVSKLVNPDHQKMGRFYQKMVKKTVQLNEKNHFFGGGGQKFGPFFHFPKPSFFMGGVRKLENHQKSWSGGYLKLFDFDQSTWQIL